MKYLKEYGESDKFWIVSIDNYDEFLEFLVKTEDISIDSFIKKTNYLESYPQPFICIDNSGGYMPLYDPKEKLNGADWFAKNDYKFSGYFKCDKETVDNYSMISPSLSKYNL